MIKPLFERVVVAVNGSEQSLHAAMYGIMLSKTYNCRLKAIYVVDTATLKQLTLSKFFLKEESQRYEKNLYSDGERYLSYVKEMAVKKGVEIDTELRHGSVWSQIIQVSDEFEANLILIGGKKVESGNGKTFVRHDKVSLTNSEIIGSAQCNVLVVKEPEIEKLFKLA